MFVYSWRPSFGFITVIEGIKVHKKIVQTYISIQSNYAYRIIQIEWIDSSQEEI
jgi:GTP pyrophosphokinase